MNDEEYYKCFVMPKELIDKAIHALAADTLLISNATILKAVTEEVGANPDKEKILWYYEQLTIETTKRICDVMNELAAEGAKATTEQARKDKMRSQTGLG